MSKVEVLMSIMSQNGIEIVERTNIKSNAVVVNQCNYEEKQNIIVNGCNVNYINTTDRGLSKSRNLAIQEATAEYCLLCDDDEVLENDYIDKIENAFSAYPDADILCFIVRREGKKYPVKRQNVNYLNSLHISSVQMVVKRESIIKYNVKFDENFGAGSPNGAGEENIFMFDCLKKNMKIYYVPIVIGTLLPSESTWFTGFNKEYFVKRGRIFRRLFGFYGYVHSLYFAISKYRRYKNQLSLIQAIALLYRGMHQIDNKTGRK